MTIPHSSSTIYLAALPRILFGLIAIFGLAAIVLYYSMVAHRSEFKKVAAHLETLQVENAEFKNQLYQYLDSNELVQSAERLGMVKESAPAYLTLDAADSNFVDISQLIPENSLSESKISVRLIAKNVLR